MGKNLQQEFTALKPEHKIKRRKNLTGDQFLELCAEKEIGIVGIFGFGWGPSNGEWWVDVIERTPNEHRTTNDTGLATGTAPSDKAGEEPSDAPVAMQEVGTAPGL